jgi:hypothetical protein
MARKAFDEQGKRYRIVYSSPEKAKAEKASRDMYKNSAVKKIGDRYTVGVKYGKKGY